LELARRAGVRELRTPLDATTTRWDCQEAPLAM
jgi:hypothetical protein